MFHAESEVRSNIQRDNSQEIANADEGYQPTDSRSSVHPKQNKGNHTSINHSMTGEIKDKEKC